MPEYGDDKQEMLLKLIGIVFVVLVFLGLGVSGTFNAALAGYHLLATNPVIQQFQSKVTNTIKTEATTQIHKAEDVATQIRSKI